MLLPPPIPPLPRPLLSTSVLGEIKFRNLLSTAQQSFIDLVFSRNADEESANDAIFLIHARRICLASYLWVSNEDSKEVVDLLESIVTTLAKLNNNNEKDDCKTTRSFQSLYYAYACELLCFILTKQCCDNDDNNTDDDDEKTKQIRIFQLAQLASSSQYDTPFSQLLTFLNRVWESCSVDSEEIRILFRDNDGGSLVMKNILKFGFQIMGCSSSTKTIRYNLQHLQRSAYDGLLEAQELLVLFWSQSHSSTTDNRKLATFIAWSFSNLTIDKLLSSRSKQSSEYTMDNILQLTGFDASSDNNSNLWVRRLRRLNRGQIQNRLTKYCNNCLFVDCSLDDCTEPEVVCCPACRFVGYCSATCQQLHWQSIHQYWCKKVPKDFETIALDHVPKSINR